MNRIRKKSSRRSLLMSLAVSMLSGWGVVQADEFSQRASWTMPTFEEVKSQTSAWLAEKKLDDSVRQAAIDLWADQEAFEFGLLDRLMATIAIVDPDIRALIEFCDDRGDDLVEPELEILVADDRAPMVRDNLKLYYARWLIESRMMDEGLAMLEAVQPTDVVDPASLLFYKASVYHYLLHKDECLATVELLLENKDSLSVRHLRMAQLMIADMKPLKTDSLDEVSRIMTDIRRRLDLGRAGTRVRKQEDDVVAKLDKMIKTLEDQKKDPGGPPKPGSGDGPGSNQPSSPKNDSTPGGTKGPGNVDSKELSDKSHWGNLPAKERQEALQRISRDFQSHFRQVCEQYFRRLAQEEEAGNR